jgi:Domain of unknown function (DUF4476)
LHHYSVPTRFVWSFAKPLGHIPMIQQIFTQYTMPFVHSRTRFVCTILFWLLARPPITENAVIDPVFPNYAYPDTNQYNGVKGCRGPVMSESAFKIAARTAYSQPTDESKYVSIQSVVDQNCLTFAQLMKFSSLMQTNNFKLKAMMYGFPKVYDQDHYPSGTVLFTNTGTQTEWTNFAKQSLTPPLPSCTVTESDLNSIIQSVHNQKYTDDKFKTLQTASKNRCYSVAQIKKLAGEFTFGSEKLKVFKLLYEKCSDKENYYKLVDELNFDSEKEELRQFIDNGGK